VCECLTDRTEVIMKEYPKEVSLKDGVRLTLRPMTQLDAEKLYAFFCALPEEDRLYLKDDVTNRELIERWTSQIDHERVLAILALQDGRVVGDATLHFEHLGWAKHVGEIRCVVASELQNKGIGTHLVHELVQHAIRRDLKKVSIMMMDCQQKAHKTFERIGFRRAATLPGHVVDIHGDEHDLVIMVNEPEDIWKRLEELMLNMDFRGDRWL
jgi:RimJ/RimL family protein N-acetyltransferase